MTTNAFEVGMNETIELLNVRLHVLPNGSQYYLPNANRHVPDLCSVLLDSPTAATVPASMRDVIAILTDI